MVFLVDDCVQKGVLEMITIRVITFLLVVAAFAFAIWMPVII